MKQKLITILIILVFLGGVGLLAYPAVSNLYYEKQQESLTDYYDSKVMEEIPDEDRTAEFQECWNYNQGLLKGGVLLTDPFDESQLDPTSMPYAGLLNVDGEGGMGYIRIPAINVKLMIYHGTTEDVLQKGVGHLQGSSLPVGGTGSHCVLSAHTGLNNKKLFTDLDQLKEGDQFYIHVLGEVLAYQVDQIKVVLPDETDDLKINAEKDYVTLITCTPYGINTHRLLVRGVRVPYVEEDEKEAQSVSRGSTWLEQYLHAALAGGGVIAAVILGTVIISNRKKHRRRRRRRRRR